MVVNEEVSSLCGQQERSMELNKLLTLRELQVVRLLSQDLSHQEIADHLQISKRTVYFHVENALRKTDCRSIVGLVVAFIKEEIRNSELK